jgi:hypothetical protein
MGRPFGPRLIGEYDGLHCPICADALRIPSRPFAEKGLVIHHGLEPQLELRIEGVIVRLLGNLTRIAESEFHAFADLSVEPFLRDSASFAIGAPETEKRPAGTLRKARIACGVVSPNEVRRRRFGR